jgi:hypothetical protein
VWFLKQKKRRQAYGQSSQRRIICSGQEKQQRSSGYNGCMHAYKFGLFFGLLNLAAAVNTSMGYGTNRR